MFTIHIESKETVVKLIGKDLQIIKKGFDKKFKISFLKNLYIHPKVLLDSKVLLALYKEKVNVFFCNEKGFPECSLHSPFYNKNASIVSKQLQIANTAFAKELSDKWIRIKQERRIALLEIHLSAIHKAALSKLKGNINTGSFLEEAQFDKRYFSLFNKCLPSDLRFKKRARRPATDLINALLNYAYSLMHKQIERAIVREGLDPYIGFKHGMPRKNKAFLFDVIEMYRPWCEDLILQNIVNWNISNFNTETLKINIKGRRFLVTKFYELLEHPVLNHKSRYKLIEEDISIIKKEINEWAKAK